MNESQPQEKKTKTQKRKELPSKEYSFPNEVNLSKV